MKERTKREIRFSILECIICASLFFLFGYAWSTDDWTAFVAVFVGTLTFFEWTTLLRKNKKRRT